MIYKMSDRVWSKIADSFPRVDKLIDENGVIEYLENECGLQDTGEWTPPEDADEHDEDFYHYRVTDEKKFTMFALRWS